jgi:hypothetical protein
LIEEEARRDLYVDGVAEVAEFGPNRAMDSFGRAFRLRIKYTRIRRRFDAAQPILLPSNRSIAANRFHCWGRLFVELLPGLR